jgi:putrescine aminotransferase
MKRDNVVETVRDDLAPYFANKWKTLGDHPLVGEARCMGLLGAIELVASKSPITRFAEKGRVGTICRDICFDVGVISRAVGDTMIVCPPLVITKDQIDELVNGLRSSLDQTIKRI